MHKPAGYLSKQSKRRIANAKNYLRRLLSAGKYDQAAEYALAQGLTLEPRSQPVTGGEGVDQPATTGNINRSAPPDGNSTKSVLTSTTPALTGEACTTPIVSSSAPSPLGVLLEGEQGAGEQGRPTNGVKARSVPVLRISDKGVVHRELGKMWYAFATRVRSNRAHSMMLWPEWEALESELGAVGKVASIVEAVGTEGARGAVVASNVNNLGKDDPVGTVVGEVWKEVPNRSMRIVTFEDGEGGNEAVCWVPRGKVPGIGQKIFMCPNEDERGGYVMVGEYGKLGGRVR